MSDIVDLCMGFLALCYFGALLWVSFILAGYVTSVLQVTGSVCVAMYVFMVVFFMGVLRWSTKTIFEVNEN